MKENIDQIQQLQRYYRLWRESNVMYEEWAKGHGLSLNSLLVLYSFFEDGEACTQKQICQKWLIPKQTVHGILKDFEKRGYIELVPVSADKRNKQIRLTPAGQEFTDHILTRLRQKELRVAEEIGFEKMNAINEDLALFIALFQKQDEKNGGGA